MAKTLEFLFDFASLNCWLAYRALPAVLARTGARLQIEPVLLGGLFKATNNQSPMTAFAVDGKRRWNTAHGGGCVSCSISPLETLPCQSERMMVGV